ncbi:MAG: helix-turn-helix domain-containing protein [Bacteroidota bacterium]
MTDKQQKILAVALELFANEGYNAVSTNMIAKQAGVSEALIFRHFQSKQGLLDALYNQVEQKVAEIGMHILNEVDPKSIISKAIDVPFSVQEKDYDFWRLQYKLKWNEAYYNPDKMKPFKDKSAWAFTELGYEQPELEAAILQKTLDSIMIDILREGNASQLPLKEFLLKKYSLL